MRGSRAEGAGRTRCVGRLAAGKADGSVDIYDAKSPNLGLVALSSVEATQGRVIDVALNSQGDRLAACSGKQVKVRVQVVARRVHGS